MSDNFFSDSLGLHQTHGGKLGIVAKVPLETKEDLSLAYTPGVAEPCRRIAKDPDAAYDLTMKGNTVAVVTNGSAVLGLGNIGALAGLPVMEGKCLLFKKFANVDAIPICVDTQDADELVETVVKISCGFGGINLEDIAAPLCFEVEQKLKERLDIPVFHDDQYGTAIVALAGLLNALKVVNKELPKVRIVMSGAGAAGSATADLLMRAGAQNVIVCDRNGALVPGRPRMDLSKMALADRTNPQACSGTLTELMEGADVFIGVSAPGIVTKAMVESMSDNAIVFAMANPTPEIMPNEAKEGGAAVVATGRSDFPNQINNVLAFPGLFRGVFDGRAHSITPKMHLAAAHALAELIPHPTAENIIPSPFDEKVALAVADAVKACC
jgi:malate dehydrogenase (oxaloacetate-decarboxylating)